MTRNGFGFCARYLLAVLLFSTIGGHAFSDPQPRQQEAGSDVKDRFLQEAPPRWEDYTRRAEQLQGSVSGHMQAVFSNKERISHSTYLFKKNAKCSIIHSSVETRIPGQTDQATFDVVGLNPNYAFALQQKSTTSPWTISQMIDLRKDSLPPDSKFKIFLDGFEDGKNVLVSLDWQGQYLAQVVRRPEFRVVDCRKLAKAGQEFIEVVCRYPEPGGKYLREGTLVFDPQRFWCLRSCEIRFKTEDSRTTKKWHVVEFGEASGSLPVPKRTLLEADSISNDGTKNKLTWEFEYALSIPTKLPADEEFTLSAFGLPEPPGLELKKPTRWYLWVALSGIILLGLAVCARLRRRAAVKA